MSSNWTKRQGGRVIFHIFPVGKFRQKQWLANPPVLKYRYAVLCSDHFPDAHYVRNHKLQSGLLIKGDLGDSKSTGYLKIHEHSSTSVIWIPV